MESLAGRAGLGLGWEDGLGMALAGLGGMT